ncbi:MAG: response regulator [Paracoccus sp. (in: a-proteobacteria)]|nr:response regulator [Paracoccus sp. (in: a-proteobacteria)]
MQIATKERTAPAPLWRAQLPGRPLAGLTVMIVEDSCFASEAVRLLCLRSGARLRRADCMASAQRHLRCYLAGVIIVDMGLPDGNGAALIAQIKAKPDAPLVIGMSGDPDNEPAALAAGADAFLHKPVESLAAFQSMILSLLPRDAHPRLRLLPDETVTAGEAALRDDLAHTDALMSATAHDPAMVSYVAQFLTSIARASHDAGLAEAAARVAADQHAGRDTGAGMARLRGIVKERLYASGGAC